MKARQSAINWWNNLSSLAKTQLCDTHTELVGSVRRWETLTGHEIEQLFKTLLIESVKFDKEFNDLTNDQTADFLHLINMPFLNDISRPIVINRYNEYRRIVEMRGLDKLYIYIP